MSNPLDVICPMCKGRYHETTPNFDASKSPDGSMFRLKDKYRKMVPPWESFQETSETRVGGIECPRCSASYYDIQGNILTDTREEDLPPEPEPEPYEGVPPLMIGYDKEKIRIERGKNRPIWEMQEEVAEYRRQHPKAGWKEIFDNVDHPYKYLKSFRDNMEGKTSRSDPNYNKKRKAKKNAK